jgi:hypothetical protein
MIWGTEIYYFFKSSYYNRSQKSGITLPDVQVFKELIDLNEHQHKLLFMHFLLLLPRHVLNIKQKVKISE